MQSVGNDYVFIDERSNGRVDNPSGIARLISERRFSVGSDGLVLISRNNDGDVGMRIFNADGSEGMTCGNALRCVGAYLNKNGEGNEFNVVTASGRRRVWLEKEMVFAEMGCAKYRDGNLPPCGIFLMPFSDDEYLFTSVSVGNPHAVAFVPSLDFDAKGVAGELSKSGIYPHGVNVEFAKIKDGVAEARVVERGSGETFGCGSGACAIAAAMKLHGLLRGGRAEVRYKGGSLFVDVDGDNSLILSGEVRMVFKGVLDID
jgi:diaminopimelate epimerase